jgi:hypothetical protein
MLSVRCSLAPILLVWLLALATPIEQCTEGAPPEKVNTVKKSLDGVVLFTATISQETRASEPVSLSLQLKNLGEELLVFNDGPLDTFLLKVKSKDGTVVPATRYLEFLGERAKGGKPRVERARDVIIELAPGKQAGVTLPLYRFFDLSLDGEYVVCVEARFTVKRGSGKIAIESLPFTIRYVRPFLRIMEDK